MTTHTKATIWTTAAIVIGIGASFGLMKGAFYVAQNTSMFNFAFRGPLSDEVVIEGLGGPEGVDEATPLGELREKKYIVRGGAAFPDISSTAFIVGDVDSGQVIASKRKREVRSIASLSKLMTAVVADEYTGLQKETVVSGTAIATYGASGGLRRGQRFTIEELLLPLLLSSSNDAAEVIAESSDRTLFMDAMNIKAASLGMVNTVYDDPSGLSAGNLSTVEDLFSLVQYIQKYRQYIFSITADRSASARGKTWYNNSRFMLSNGYVGGKNGYTDEAGKTNIALFSLSLAGGEKNDDTRTIAIIVFDSSNPKADTDMIVKYLNTYVYYE
jgi:D-alanyl-D-alanine carboxypeptidase